MKSIFPIITREKQAAFEAQATAAQKDEIPCICGYYGRGCPLAAFCEE